MALKESEESQRTTYTVAEDWDAAVGVAAGGLDEDEGLTHGLSDGERDAGTCTSCLELCPSLAEPAGRRGSGSAQGSSCDLDRGTKRG